MSIPPMETTDVDVGAPPSVGGTRGKKEPTALELAARSRRRRTLGLNIASVILGILIWHVAAASGIRIPTPLETFQQFGTMIGRGILQGDIAASLTRVLTGFALGTLLAIPVGFLMGWYAIARGLLEPWIQFFRTIPPLALIPLVVVLMGIGERPKIFVIFLAAFLSCVISTYQGVVSVDNTLINAAKVLGAKDGTIFAKVVVPASTPFILVGMRIGLGSAWATVVAAELIAANKGLGYRMQYSTLYYDMPTIFVALVTIGVFGLVMDRLLLFAEEKLTGWQERRSA